MIISIQGGEIESTEKLNLLSVTIDSKLNFSHHVNNVCKKASQRIEVLMKVKNLIPTEAKLQLNKAAILSHLTYCHLICFFYKEKAWARQYKKEDSGQYLRIKILATRNYWQKQTSLYSRWLQNSAIFMLTIKHKLLQ